MRERREVIDLDLWRLGGCLRSVVQLSRRCPISVAQLWQKLQDLLGC